jgi:putative hydrolase of HD superfamily
MSIERDLELIYEIGCVRFISRTWKQMLGADFANLAEHHFRLAWTALILAKMEGQGNHEKILKMALVHDIPESRTGDVHHISRIYTQRNEDKAIQDIFENTVLGEEMIAIFHEYEKKESIEAQIVKDADNLEVDFELHEQASKGNDLEKQWRNNREQSIFPRLYTESGKKLWKAIQNSNVHDWHLHAPNRYNSGDWKIET